MSLQINNIRRICTGYTHSAFTDLIVNPFDRDSLLCGYRKASRHMSHDGRIEVATLDVTAQISTRQHLRLPGRCLRDPKFSVDSRGILWLTALAKAMGAKGNVR